MGDGFIGLSAKSYYCFTNNPDTKEKYSSKGVSRKLLLTREEYMDVLNTKKSHHVVNKGFMLKNQIMHSYELQKVGLSYFYGKRKVLEDGYSTTYLDI